MHALADDVLRRAEQEAGGRRRDLHVAALAVEHEDHVAHGLDQRALLGLERDELGSRCRCRLDLTLGGTEALLGPEQLLPQPAVLRVEFDS